tara:strand:- start:1112 stop:1498 length:387 start_codon:yes stop_codon:yes gene_type:complete
MELKLQEFKWEMEASTLKDNIKTLRGFEYMSQLDPEYKELGDALIAVMVDVITAKSPKLLEIRADVMAKQAKIDALKDNNEWWAMRTVGALSVDLVSLEAKLAREIRKNVEDSNTCNFILSQIIERGS